MKRRRKIFIMAVIFTCLALYLANSSFLKAQLIPQGQGMGPIERKAEEQKEKAVVEDKLKKGKKKSVIEEEEPLRPAEAPAKKPAKPGTSLLINRVDVTGITVIGPEKVRSIVSSYEGKSLNLRDFNTMAETITQEYRSRGYVTSMAYLVPQKIEDNTLRIAAAEGRVGNINIEGNEHFTTNIYKRYIQMDSGDLFNYDLLRRNLNYINEHPDRTAKVILARGKERGQTDINVQVEDKLPLHATLGYNNYNSHYLGKHKYSVELKSTNFLGLDHVASGEFQLGHKNQFQLYSGKYIVPITPQLSMGGRYIHVNQELGEDLDILDIEGKGHIFSAFYSYKLLDEEDIALSISPGFDFKNIENEILDTVISKDKVRIINLGIDMDITDPFGGRTIVAHELGCGIEDFMGSLDKDDPLISRTEAGGTFLRSVTNAARIQALPLDMTLMLRGAMQLSSEPLVATEQFILGGPTTVRGYTVAEVTGDHGVSTSAELYIPAYFVPKDLKVPFTESTFYDSFRFLCFFDWGLARNKNPQVGEDKTDSIAGFGPGIRFDIPGKASLSVDWGFALGQDPADGDDSKVYIEAKVFF